jgi:hypothetical protein
MQVQGEVPPYAAARAVAVGAVWLAVAALCMSWTLHAPYWIGDKLFGVFVSHALDMAERDGGVRNTQWMYRLSCAVFGLLVYQRLVSDTLRSVVSTFVRHRNVWPWLWKWGEVLVVLGASAAAPVYIAGVVTWGISFCDASVTSTYPPPVASTFHFGILGLTLCYMLLQG